MQKYTEIEESKTLRESRELLLNNDKTAISCSSGSAFPTINLQPGMLCFRTDEQKLYQLNTNGETWVELFDLSSNAGLVSRATTANNALKANGHTVNADVPVNAKFTDTTYGAVTDSASGLMTAAQKKKLDSLSNYSLPVASATTLGGVKVGSGLTISNGVVSSSVTGGNATHGEKLFTANGTFVVPKGVSILVVTAVGGGGGGGAGGGNEYDRGKPGGAGGRGSVTSSIPVTVTPGESIPVIVGQGGVGGGYPHIAGSGGAGDPSGANGTANDHNSNYWGGKGGAGGSKYNSLGGTGGATGDTTNSDNTNAGGGGGGGGASSFKAFVYASGGGGGAGACTADDQATGGRGGNAAPILYDYKVSTSYGAGGAAGPKASKGGNGSAGCVYIRW